MSIQLTKVTKPILSSAEASKRTIRRRSRELSLHRNATSKGEPVKQLQAEIGSLNSEERQELLKGLHFKIELPALTSLAMKSDMCLPWNKLRVARR